jgi:tetratricopeptide (TPR) repeat protein
MLAVLCVAVVAAEAPEPPLDEKRLTVHTLVREDLFAGFLTDDMDRLTRGEKNIELLLEKRPAEKASLLAWKASAALYRAVRDHEAGKADGFRQRHDAALALFAEALRLAPQNTGVYAITGGAYAILADRLPTERREAAWSRAYEAYQHLWKAQSPVLERLPVHIRGELLAGLAQSAQRTGRTAEREQFVARMLQVLRDTPYEAVAKEWKSNPDAARTGSITCQSCHEPGRLADRLEMLKKPTQ